jgi:hypothetical protein
MSANNADTKGESETNYAVWYDFGAIHVGPRKAAYGHPATQSFVVADDSVNDHVRGDVPETEQTPVFLEKTGCYYITPKDIDAINDSYRVALANAGYTLIEGVDAGWQSWDGRPEWSESYIDYSETKIVEEI